MKPISFLRVCTVLGMFMLSRVEAKAQDTYYAHYGSTFFNAGLITPSPDKGFYGLTRSSNNTVLYYYKVDEEGNLVWMRQAPQPPEHAHVAITTLSDSTFAFLTKNPSVDSTFVHKVSDNGELLWSTYLYYGLGGQFHALAPTTDGGMLLAGSGCGLKAMIVHLDAQGAIRSQHRHTSPNSQSSIFQILEFVHDGNDQYFLHGVTALPDTNTTVFIFARTDSAGTITNYQEVHLPFGASTFGIVRRAVRSSTGGHFYVSTLNDPVRNYFILLYFNEQDQLVWAKRFIADTELMVLRGITETIDGGCVMVGDHFFTTQPIVTAPFAVKVDTAGDVVWSRLVGDSAVAGWRNFSINSVKVMSDGGFMTLPIRNNAFDFCKVDQDFNGFCYNLPYTVEVEDLSPLVQSYPIYQLPVDFITEQRTISPVPYDLPRTDLCSYTSIGEVYRVPELTISPNPASDHFRMDLGATRTHRARVSLIDARGSVHSIAWFNVVPGSSLEIPVSHLPAGLYVVDVQLNGARQHARVMVQR